jgi:imidazoleglycerol-phosphate dehydratase
MAATRTKKRSAKVTRTTSETDVKLQLIVEGKGKCSVSTGIPFMDHMLTLTAAHGFFDLTLNAKGDTEVDDHHTIEDVGIVLGEAFSKALGDRGRIKRYGRGVVPMDEAMASVVVDFSNRPFLVYNVKLKREMIGFFDAQICEEFFRAFVNRSGTTLHINVMYGENTHHIIEAVFKAFGQALDEATMFDSRIGTVRSTKGVL